MDDPFHYSDDVNRGLIFFSVVLWPARFISEALVDMASLVMHAGDTGS